MKRYILSIVALALVIISAGIALDHSSVSEAAVGPTIEGYYSPCRYGTESHVTTWHGLNQDGQPPYNPERRTYDFRCQDKAIYSVMEGVVWGVTPRFGGVILVQDYVQNDCVVYLGMHTAYVEPNQAVTVGTPIGIYGHAFHFTAVDGSCPDVNWYDTEARERERPVAWLEFGEVIRQDITKTEPLYFTSMNPGGSAIWYGEQFHQILSKLFTS